MSIHVCPLHINSLKTDFKSWDHPEYKGHMSIESRGCLGLWPNNVWAFSSTLRADFHSQDHPD